MLLKNLMILRAVAIPPSLPRRALACAVDSVADNLAAVERRVASAADATRRPAPRLVAVSKTKPVELLLEAYGAGQRCFGENYVQELVAKAPQLPDDVEWRFIGKLQSNKAKVLVHGVPSLTAVETLDSTKLADRLQKAADGMSPPRVSPLDVMVQVNTSPWEGSKGGVDAADAATLARHVTTACPALRLAGLMTIGAPGEERCFEALRACRDAVAAELGLPPAELELSMGMSADFEAAIRLQSDSVRLGSSIFGARAYPDVS